jgi:tetratricopeptide (TPR) repeat protein
MLPAQRVSQQYSAVLDSLQSLGWHYFMNGQFEEGVSVLERGVELVGAESIPHSYIQLLLTYGHVLLWQSSLLTGDYTRPMKVLQDAAERAEMLENDTVQARAYDELGFCHYQRALTGDRSFEDADNYFQRALVLWERIGDIAGICTARFHTGLIAERAGQFDTAVAHFTWVSTTAQAHHLPSQQAEASRHLGFAALRAADYEQALAAFQDALALTEAQQSR